MRKNRTSRMRTLIFGGAAIACMAFAHASGADPGLTGAPGDDGTCVLCHQGVLNSGAGRVTITFPGGNTYTPGATVRMRVTVEDPTARRWGFSLTVKKEASTTFVGAFAVPATGTAATTRIVTGLASSRYMTHTINGTFRQQATQAAWEFDWTAPAAGTGPVRFYAAGNAANNDADVTGDHIYATNLSIAEATNGPPPAIVAGNTILSQFVFGGGWTSSLYFTNNSDTQVSFPVRFYNDSAVDMPFAGASTKQLIIPLKGTALIQAQNTGSLQQGWATFDMPAGVTGYGVFRQAVPGIPDQEAVVPFATSTGTRASLTYDDSNLITAAAIWYNGVSSATVTLTARDEAGQQIGTANITMTPGTKVAFALKERIPAVEFKRGLVEFTTSTGNIAVLGLRFAGSAFTSIPPAP